jgi:hypothetical protein
MGGPEYEYDPERALWRPGRRSFLFMSGIALMGALVPGHDILIGVPTNSTLVTPSWVTREVAKHFVNSLRLTSHVNPYYGSWSMR